MQISTAVVSDGKHKDVQITLLMNDCSSVLTFRLDAKSSKALAAALAKCAAEAESLLVMPTFDSTPGKGA